MSKKMELDEARVNVVKRVLALPPKKHEDMKVGRPSTKRNATLKAALLPPSGVVLNELLTIRYFR